MSWEVILNGLIPYSFIKTNRSDWLLEMISKKIMFAYYIEQIIKGRRILILSIISQHMKNQHRPLTFLINQIKLTYLVKYFWHEYFNEICYELHRFETPETYFQKSRLSKYFEKIKIRWRFEHDTNFWKVAIIVAWDSSPPVYSPLIVAPLYLST